jgi:hypothetical protein
MRMNRLALILVSATLAACTAPTDNNNNNNPSNPTQATKPGDHMVLPSLNGAMPHLQSGMITLTGDTGPGSATFSNAALWADDSGGPPAYGTGDFSVTLGTSTFASATGESLFATLPDDAGNSYLVLGVMSEDEVAGRVQIVYVVTKQNDFIPGADIALDGVDRYALYVAGPYDSENPDTLAVASTGTVHFDATATLTGPLTASLSATFAAADPGALGPDSPDGGPREPGDGGVDGGTIDPPLAGGYTMHFGALQQAQCDGTLAGKEADFSALAASSFGFVDQAVTIDIAGSDVSLSGPGLATAFGADPIPLTTDGSAPFWQYVNETTGSAGPDGTTLGYQMLGLDSSTPAPYAGQAAVVYIAGDRSSYCALDFEVTFTSP